MNGLPQQNDFISNHQRLHNFFSYQNKHLTWNKPFRPLPKLSSKEAMIEESKTGIIRSFSGLHVGSLCTVLDSARFLHSQCWISSQRRFTLTGPRLISSRLNMFTAVDTMINVGAELPIRMEHQSNENLGSNQAFSRGSKQISLILSSEINNQMFDKRAPNPSGPRTQIGN